MHINETPLSAFHPLSLFQDSPFFCPSIFIQQTFLILKKILQKHYQGVAETKRVQIESLSATTLFFKNTQHNAK